MNLLDMIMSDFHIMLDGSLFEVHSTVESARKTVKCMKASGDYEGCKIEIRGVN